MIRACSLALLALVSACGSNANSAEVWRFAIEETAGSVQDSYAQEFKRRIEARTNGEVEVKVYPYGSLGTSDDISEQLRMGSLQFAMASPGHLGKTIPELQMLLLHFVFSDEDEVNRAVLVDPTLRAALDPLFREKGFQLLAFLQEGWMVWTTQKEIREPADFEGVKIRTMTSPLLLAAYEAYGAKPQAMPYGEVYSALQLNMIDAQVNPVFSIEEMSFYEVTDYMIFANPVPFLATAVTNPDFMSGLTPERRALVQEVTAELADYIMEVQQTTNLERLDVIRERKPELELVRLEPEEREAFRVKSLPVRETFAELAGERGEELLGVLLDTVAKAEQAYDQSTGTDTAE